VNTDDWFLLAKKISADFLFTQLTTIFVSWCIKRRQIQQFLLLSFFSHLCLHNFCRPHKVVCSSYKLKFNHPPSTSPFCKQSRQPITIQDCVGRLKVFKTRLIFFCRPRKIKQKYQLLCEYRRTIFVGTRPTRTRSSVFC